MLSTHLWKMLTAALILLCWIQGCAGNTQLTMTKQFDWRCKPPRITSRVAYIQIKKFEQHPDNTQILASAYQNSSEVASEFLRQMPGAEAGGSVLEGFLNLTYQTAQGNSSETFQCVWAYNDEYGDRSESTPYNITLNEDTPNITLNTESFFSVKEKFTVYIKVTKASLSHGLIKTEPFFVSTAIGNNSAHQTSNKKTPLWQCEKARGVCNLTGIAVSDDVTLNLTCSQESPQSEKFNCKDLPPYHEVRLDDSQHCSNSINILSVAIPIACCIICLVIGIAIGFRMKNSIANALKNIPNCFPNICSKSKTKETSIQNPDEKPTENKDVAVKIENSGDDTDESGDGDDTDESGDGNDTDESGDDPFRAAVLKRPFKVEDNKFCSSSNLKRGEKPRLSGVESNDANGQKKKLLFDV